MNDDPSGQENEPALADLDERLRERLRRASGGGGELTHAELLELADALSRQRQEVAEALADLRRREAEVTRVRGVLEQTSLDAQRVLDERDVRLSALAAELDAERQRLDERARALSAAERPVPAPPPGPARPEGGLDFVVAELRARLERVEAALELRERLERVEAALAGRMDAVREQALAQIEDRLCRLERLIGELAGALRQPLDAIRGSDASPEQHAPGPPIDGRSAVEPHESPSTDGPSPEEAPAAEPDTGHVLFVAASSGYRLLERDGPAPAVGERLVLEELDQARATVTGLRTSPLPGDARACVACLIDDARSVAGNREPASADDQT
ncbi:MAG TPA: hypothetical protein VGQ38_03460 [Gaiellaceae bacterium]|nr:hypothetical protein [Gaiellaceae bacterium]